MNQLNNIKNFTNIVMDTSNLELIKKYLPQDVTTNPSLICKEMTSYVYQEFISDAVSYANKQGGDKKIRLKNANDKLFVNISKEILKLISGRISIELDVRLSFNCSALIKRAKKIISLCNKNGIEKNRILIKLAATWEGIKAAEILEKSGINCNLTLVFSLVQARACAEAQVYLISPFIGRICDWYVKNKKMQHKSSLYLDPGIKLVYKIYNFYKQRNYNTMIMGASFRSLKQIYALIGCDAITISPVFFEQLSRMQASKIISYNIVPNLNKIKKLSESKFRWHYNYNAMAIEKLSEGIRLFFHDQKKIDNVFLKYL